MFKQINYKHSDLYVLCGRDDSVVSITFKPNSNSEKVYGDTIIVLLLYTLKERDLLENNVFALDNTSTIVRAKLLVNSNSSLTKLLATDGFDINDVLSIEKIDNIESSNKYYNKDKRQLRTINVNTAIGDNEQETECWYNFLELLKSKQIALTPDEEIQYLAYKSCFAKDKMTGEEYDLVYDNNGNIKNEDVYYYQLMYENSLHPLESSKMKLLIQIHNKRLNIILKKMDLHFKGLGGFDTFLKKYPKKANLLWQRVMSFRDIRYSNGKHLLYLDIDGFLHIYVRHVEDLSTPHQYVDRTKFQLHEEDVLSVIRYIMTEIDDEYQIFKDINPNREFSKYSDKSYYLKGDYYAFKIDKNGRLITFYKTQQRIG